MRSQMWDLMLVRGILGVILGVMLFAWPEKSVEAFVMLFGLFAILAGLLSIVGAIWARHHVWGLSFTGGILTLLIGLLAFLGPGITATVLVWLVAVWALVFGVVEILAGALLPGGEMLRAVAMGIGLVTVALGALLLVDPRVGIVAASLLVGLYLLMSGALTIYHALMLRSARRTVIIQ